MSVFIKRSRLACSARELYDWHCRPEAFADLQPPWEKVVQLSQAQELHAGQTVRIQISMGPVGLPWVSEITELQPGLGFTDIQRQGPFAFWKHEHRFIPEDESHCWLEDHITYSLPLEPVSHWIAGGVVRRRLERMFVHRHAVMCSIFACDSVTSGEDPSC